MRVLGIDLAQKCGVALVEIFEAPRRVEVPAGLHAWCKPFVGDVYGVVKQSEIVDLGHGKDALYGSSNLPVGVVQAGWLGRAEARLIRVLEEYQTAELVVVEVPDAFMMGYRMNKRGEMRKASDPRTIQSMLRLSAIAFASFYAVHGDTGADGVRIETVSPNQWQRGLLHGMPVNGLMNDGMEQTKAQSLVGAWMHLLFECDSPDETDAALMATWKALDLRKQSERAEQLELFKQSGRKKQRVWQNAR